MGLLTNIYASTHRSLRPSLLGLMFQLVSRSRNRFSAAFGRQAGHAEFVWEPHPGKEPPRCRTICSKSPPDASRLDYPSSFCSRHILFLSLFLVPSLFLFSLFSPQHVRKWATGSKPLRWSCCFSGSPQNEPNLEDEGFIMPPRLSTLKAKPFILPRSTRTQTRMMTIWMNMVSSPPIRSGFDSSPESQTEHFWMSPILIVPSRLLRVEADCLYLLQDKCHFLIMHALHHRMGLLNSMTLSDINNW